MKRYLILLCLVMSLFSAKSQQLAPYPATLKVAIMAPLYLDSAYNSDWEKGNLPKYMLPGLEFVQGATIALDTMQKSDVKIEAHIIDTKAGIRTVPWLIKYGGLDKMNLIIGSVKEPEFRQLADFAAAKHIPFISATYPNDGGIRNNPYLAVVNTTLKGHLDGIYGYLVQRHSMSQILLIKKRNDNRIENIFREINKATSAPLLKYRTIAVDSINASQLAMLIDTTKPAIIVGASLNENFALNLADACYPLAKTNDITLIGMPNWDGFKEFYNQERYKDFPILFTTPHTDADSSAFKNFLGNTYFTKYLARPTDMAYKGFESAYYFINILRAHPDSVMEHLNEDQFACFHTFNFQPVFLSGNETPDYFENKKVTIVEILNGEMRKRW